MAIFTHPTFLGAPDHRIAVYDFPGADPAFILMHGFPDHAFIYDRLISALAGHHRVAFDFRGWGNSDKPSPADATSSGQELDLATVVAALHLTSPILVAHDASGPVVLNWALAHPPFVGGNALRNT
ncbi:MAG: alpha/beta fold hydrolase [Ktedonobacterales bacterium]|nr:alpha/beta fold hydrolase [Ktedonobacterales bacterium]